ncbi:MAG: exodeoxyribonuclease VII small subunit [Chloracidobacterium sp.]|nr:exodeoxyribonuclease VII small subunit [Chloracidobacterium sp.]MCO5333285.1 exodeoxyribonuclease VII small subunit [Pyrinomonadaceae bacterium]
MEQSFESSLNQLEAIVQKLEAGELTLEESLGLFEKGVTLVKDCRTRLTTAERRIEKLTRELNGDFNVEEMPDDEAGEN